MSNSLHHVAVLHGAGYAGGELIHLLLSHPHVELSLVTSRAFAGEPVWKAHPSLRGKTDLIFTSDEESDLENIDAVLIAAEHGKGAEAVLRLIADDFAGVLIDLSADFRFRDPSLYELWFGFTHPAPELIDRFEYGLPEVNAPYLPETRFIANPGCFATALSLALWPLTQSLPSIHAAVTALTGASGSGSRPKETTHFPTRDGNVRAYKVMNHQHLPEVEQILGERARVVFTPVSGPWTRGIWGTAYVELPEEVDADAVRTWYTDAYAYKPFVRVWDDRLPELRYSVNTPYFDVGIAATGRDLVIGFALDNLLKGAASQAVQNLNLLLGLPEAGGLLPSTIRHTVDI